MIDVQNFVAMGRGEGGGANNSDVAAGSIVAIVFTVIMCCFGIPLIIVGSVFVVIQVPGEYL